MPVNILDLKDNFDLFVFDIYGVIWDGKKIIPGSLDTLEDLKRAGKKVVLLSNGTVSAEHVEEAYAKRGFVKGQHIDYAVSSGQVYHDFLMKETKAFKVYQFGRPNEFVYSGSSYEQTDDPKKADLFYAGVPQICENGVWKDFLTLEPFEKELRYLLSLGKKMVCANPDLRAFENQYDEAVVRNGLVAEFYEKNGGEVEYWGKPYANVYEYVFQKEIIKPESSLMVGDTLRTDILGGLNFGMKTALTMSGISYDDMLKQGIKDMKVYAEKCGIVPDYIVEQI